MTDEPQDELPVFICYRQADGTGAANRLHARLHNYSMTTAGRSLRLDVYLDTSAAAVADWTTIHLPSLQRSKAFIFVMTPGSFAYLGKDDWVHRELQWWLTNRKAAPIIVDAGNHEDKWLPAALKKKWPNAQRVVLPASCDAATEERILKPILDGILLSGTSVFFEDIAILRKLLLRFKIALWGAAVSTLAAVCVAGFTLFLNTRVTASNDQIERVSQLLERTIESNLKTVDANVNYLRALTMDKTSQARSEVFQRGQPFQGENSDDTGDNGLQSFERDEMIESFVATKLQLMEVKKLLPEFEALAKDLRALKDLR